MSGPEIHKSATVSLEELTLILDGYKADEPKGVALLSDDH
jgi:hypothetical protein